MVQNVPVRIAAKVFKKDATCDEVILRDTVRNLFKVYDGQNGYKGGDMYGQNFRETRTR